ncbi:hypothetical protein niasHT_008247 [Heterodera trifolii]|uniref:DNA helicase n=1 Tax=Heterodera trifolii TaxID=157864 RepID=A0ABD2M172_9BILA
MPSKDQRRKEANRLRSRATRHAPNLTDALGGPNTSDQQSFGLDPEPSTSTNIRAQSSQPRGDVEAAVGTSAMVLGTNVVSTPTTTGLRALSIIGGSSNKRTRRNGAVGTPNNEYQHNLGQSADTSDVESVADTRRRKSAPTILAAGASTPRYTSARRTKLNEANAKQIEEKMAKVVRDYLARDWPNPTAQQTRRRSSLLNTLQKNIFTRQTGVRDKSLPPERNSIDYYDSGQFGDSFCGQCSARLLPGENELVKRGRKSACCANGAIHTGQMISELDELQSPPRAYLEGLVDAVDERVREALLNNAMAFNNLFAFASTHGEKAPADQMGGRLDTCKYNGQFSFLFSDLIAPGVRRPSFAQVYTLTPEDALNLRVEALDTAISPHVRRTIIERLEALMRENPFGQTFQTVGTKVEAARAATGQLPHFRIALLTDRQLRGASLQGRRDITVIERADAPTAKQVAVIWIQEDGLPPQISAFWVSDKAGKMRELKSGMPQIDPCCFPLLHPRGTLGWRWYMKKCGSENTRPEMQLEEQEHDQISDDEFGDEVPIDDIVGTLQNEDELEEMPEPELELDDEVDEEQEEDNINAVGTSTAQPNPGRDGHEDVIFDNEVATRGGRTNISERQFYRYRMALRGSGKNTFHWLWFARRLAEYFTISVLNRIERNDLDHLKAIQEKKNYRQILAREYIAAMEKGVRQQGPNAKLGRIFLMPQTFAGSRQYYQGKYADLMTMVRHLGAPTWFVTFTGNPKWPEIDEALRVRQNYAHRPDIVCRIFMDKAAEFIRDVTERGVLGKVAGWCYSVEHQKRGMPHIHMLLILERGVRIDTAQQVDEYVSARIPTLPPSSDQSPEAHQQRRLWHYVTSMMLHDCNAACLEGSRCRKHFPKPFSDRTELSEVRYTNYVRIPPDESDAFFGRAGGYDNQPDNDHHDPAADPERDWAEVRYQRIPQQGRVPARQHGDYGQTHYKKKRGVRSAILMDDSRVIPYNPFLLLKYGCHINVEYVFGQKACKYIFKYLLKGFEKAYVRVAQPRRSAQQSRNDGTAGADEVYDYDEIAATFKVRYMTAMEAYLRLNSYKIVGTSHQIYTLSVHDELGQTIVVEEGHEEEGRWRVRENTRLTAFFALCGTDPEAAELTYDRIPYRYSWDYRSRSWKKRVRSLEEDPDKTKMFVRVYTVSPRKHELFALRTLLLHRPGPKSFTDLRTVDGIQFETFVGTCQFLGLQVSDEVFRRAMQEACAEMSNLKRLQHYFAMLLAHAHPSSGRAWHSLTINMRTAAGEQSLRDWLEEIGNGMHRVGTENQGFTNQLRIPPELLVDDLDHTIHFCFPEALFDDPLANADAIAHNAILCPTNNDVQHINEVALGRMSGCGREFLSIDEPLEPNEEMHNFRTDFNMETVHNEMPSGMPPHKLTIKVGTPVMLIRNLDVTQGLCNGTRLQVMRTSENNLFCRILTGPRAGAQNIIAIPQIQFEYGRARHHRGLRFRRLQFPVRLCFAMTINKAQGQTLQRMALVLNGRQCFSHGQVYVAMSRVTQMDGIRVYAPFCQSGYGTHIENVVYHELLDVEPQQPRTPIRGLIDVDNDPDAAIPDVGPRVTDVDTDPDVERDNGTAAGANDQEPNDLDSSFDDFFD